VREALARCAKGAAGPGTDFRRVYMGSTLPQARAQQVRARHEDDVAAALTARLGLPAGDPVPRLLAHQVLDVPPLAFGLAETARLAGAGAADIRRRTEQLVNYAFDIWENSAAALAGPTTGPHTPRGSATGK
jgi:hypothetical protein